MEEKLDGNYTKMLRAILNKSWRRHPKEQQLFGHLPPSRKLSKLDEPDMRNTAGELGTSSYVIYSCGPLHMAEQRQDDKLKPTYSSSEGVLRIPQSSSITGTSPSDCLVSYPGHSLGGILPLCRGTVGVLYSPGRLSIYIRDYDIVFSIKIKIIEHNSL